MKVWYLSVRATTSWKTGGGIGNTPDFEKLTQRWIDFNIIWPLLTSLNPDIRFLLNTEINGLSLIISPLIF